jgi:hypothetical protein
MDDASRLMKIAKRILNRRIYKKIKNIEDNKEKEDALRYSIASALEIREHELQKKIRELEEKNKDAFFASTKLALVPFKIKMFRASFNPKDLAGLMKILNDVESEIKNV